ncbi:hypothetical protein BpHYR1_050827 [Brachionus plicatilis]|uniref:Uncharacterized protein n=1 Tax=Brachionus plicatilis TaxID=10195 RepID=A0A3M7T7V4_BRAPC|nr:hypothetical protein BpHYR1_050827 [Brachionus plicatilis]
MGICSKLQNVILPVLRFIVKHCKEKKVLNSNINFSRAKPTINLLEIFYGQQIDKKIDDQIGLIEHDDKFSG